MQFTKTSHQKAKPLQAPTKPEFSSRGAIPLYEPNGQWLALARELANTDLDAQTIVDTLEGSATQMTLEEKVQSYEMAARSMEAPVAAIDAEIERLQDLKANVIRRAEALRDRVRSTMQEQGIQKVSCPLFEVRRQKNPPSLVIEDEIALPAKYWHKPTNKVLDKDALRADLKAGKTVIGAHLIQSESLRIS